MPPTWRAVRQERDRQGRREGHRANIETPFGRWRSVPPSRVTRLTVAGPRSTSWRDGMDHAWSWFSLHAAQRMQLVNFWLIATAFLTAGYVSAIDSKRPGVALGVAVVGATTTVGFHALERRTRHLTQMGETALKALQTQLAEASGLPSLKIIEIANAHHSSRFGYGTVIRLMHFAVIAGYLAAAIYAVTEL